MSNDSLILQTRAALDGGLCDEGLSIAKSRNTREIEDAGLHLERADILEELVLPDDVIFELHLAIRDDPKIGPDLRGLRPITNSATSRQL
jgi:hypothetical protein